MAATTTEQSRHRDFLNAYYGWARSSYDWTRRYYLLGRDTVLDELVRDDWTRLIEIGPGTGRNLQRLRQRRPGARYGGVDACDAMLELATERCPWARIVHGFAEDAALESILDEPPDRILLSYCLSMVRDPVAVLENARRALAPGGRVVVVDFADAAGLPAPLPGLLRTWLARFHVSPLDPEPLRRLGGHLRFGPGRYWLSATLGG